MILNIKILFHMQEHDVIILIKIHYYLLCANQLRKTCLVRWLEIIIYALAKIVIVHDYGVRSD